MNCNHTITFLQSGHELLSTTLSTEKSQPGEQTCEQLKRANEINARTWFAHGIIHHIFAANIPAVNNFLFPELKNPSGSRLGRISRFNCMPEWLHLPIRTEMLYH